MKMNQTTDHAIRIILLLAKKKAIVSSNAIADQTKVSRRYLFRIVSRLRDAGLVAVTKGPDGGYQLSKPAEDISLYDIIYLMEGPIQLPDHAYAIHSDNALGSIYVFFKGFFEEYTKRITFDDLATNTHSDILQSIYELVIEKKAEMHS